MHDGFGEEIVKPAIVAALGRGVVDLEQGFGFGPADRLMFDRGRGQDARAPGGVIGIKRAGKMDTALGGRAFAGDHAVTHDGERVGCGLPAGWFEGAVGFGGLVRRARHGCTSQFFVLVQHVHAGGERGVNDSIVGSLVFYMVADWSHLFPSPFGDPTMRG